MTAPAEHPPSGLPFVTPDIPAIPGELRVELEDFRVEELPAYPPSGEGTHLFVHLEKRDLTTPEAVRRLADALGVDPRQAGWAGLKDRRGVTRQWVSLASANRDAALAATVEGVEVLEASLHGHKLRTGHLRGNRFELRLRGAPADRLGDARLLLDRLTQGGLPNYFGPQRFGRDGRTVDDATRWLIEGGRAPRDRFRRKLLSSALQSALFNAVVARRVEADLLDHALSGDVLRKEDSGGLFLAEDVAVENERIARWETSPTGPLPGPKMMMPTGPAAELETAAERLLGWPPPDTPEAAALAQRLGKAAPGTRRAARVRPTDASVSVSPDGLDFAFALPSGSYATAVMREVTKQP